MLNWSSVLSYVKLTLGIPHGIIELSDSDLQSHLINTALKDFSMYVPDVEYVAVDASDVNIQHPSKQNYYYLHDPENLPIYGIKQIFFKSGTDGHPLAGPTSLEDAKAWALYVFKSRTLKQFSNFNYTYKFEEPNLIRVLPSYSGVMAVEYEREQPSDLRKIPAYLNRLYMDLCLAETKLILGAIRTNFGDGRVSTPFGEIPLNGAEMKTEGNELKREVIDKLSDFSMPSVVVDIG